MANDDKAQVLELLDKTKILVEDFGSKTSSMLFIVGSDDGSIAVSHYGTIGELLNILTNTIFDERIAGHRIVRDWAQFLIDQSVRH